MWKSYCFSYKSLDAVFIGTLDDPENWQPNGVHLGIESQIRGTLYTMTCRSIERR